MLTRIMLAFRLALGLHVRVFAIRRKMLQGLGRDVVSREFPELGQFFAFHITLETVRHAMRGVEDPSVVAEKNRLRQIWRQLKSQRFERNGPMSEPARRVLRASLARCMRAICQAGPTTEQIEALPTSTSLPVALTRWLEYCGAHCDAATCKHLARAIGPFSRQSIILDRLDGLPWQQARDRYQGELDRKYHEAVQSAAEADVLQQFKIKELAFLAAPSAWVAAARPG